MIGQDPNKSSGSRHKAQILLRPITMYEGSEPYSVLVFHNQNSNYDSMEFSILQVDSDQYLY